MKEERQERILAQFRAREDDFERYTFLIKTAMDSPFAGGASLRREPYRIPECEAGLWADVRLTEGRLSILCESDSLLVQGLACLIAEVFAGLTPTQAQATELYFPGLLMEETGILDAILYGQTGLTGLVARIRQYY